MKLCHILFPIFEQSIFYKFQASHFSVGSPSEAFDPGSDPRPEPPLLLHLHQLPQERAGTADADEPQQEVLDGRSHSQRLQGTLSTQQGNVCRLIVFDEK